MFLRHNEGKFQESADLKMIISGWEHVERQRAAVSLTSRAIHVSSLTVKNRDDG